MKPKRNRERRDAHELWIKQLQNRGSNGSDDDLEYRIADYQQFPVVDGQLHFMA